MTAHWKYLKYLLRHKWFVFIAGRRVGAPLWRLLIHDWSKFLPAEWKPYACYFYDAPYVGIEQDFDRAWLRHQHWNKHHWQHWVLHEDSGRAKFLEMPESYAREMVADWMGAGRAITGRWDVHSWYEKNQHNMMLHTGTRNLVKCILNGLSYLLVEDSKL